MRYPLIEELAVPPSAAELFHVIKDRRCSFFLDSGMDPKRLGRYSFMGSDPFLVVSSHGSEVTLTRGREREVRWGNPFDVVFGLLDEYTLDRGPTPVPFVGGAVGYFGYDLCHFVEDVPSTIVDDVHIPECCFAFYDYVVAFDHMDGKVYVVATGFPDVDEGQRLKRARLRLAELKERFCANSPGVLGGQGERDGVTMGSSCDEGGAAASLRNAGQGREVLLRASFTREEYVRAVEKVRDYIAAGDVFQVNLSQRFDADLQASPYDLYRRLRAVNPAPFASYLDLPGVTVVSASPERFLKRQGDLVETRPIKGTRPRGRDAVDDDRLARELTGSAKDRAENVMIVDLERNDLGRICRYGTVQVTELAVLETFPTVHHLTSTVIGRLHEGSKNTDLLKAMFPGGSITGAPKVRAMQIIDELEPVKRGPYGGGFGCVGLDGEMDIALTLRTIVIPLSRCDARTGHW
ncbi:MAG: anthranilate synthase component I family protein, partial [Dehalococcoidia bacterium]